MYVNTLISSMGKTTLFWPKAPLLYSGLMCTRVQRPWRPQSPKWNHVKHVVVLPLQLKFIWTLLENWECFGKCILMFFVSTCLSLSLLLFSMHKNVIVTDAAVPVSIHVKYRVFLNLDWIFVLFSVVVPPLSVVIETDVPTPGNWGCLL